MLPQVVDGGNDNHFGVSASHLQEFAELEHKDVILAANIEGILFAYYTFTLFFQLEGLVMNIVKRHTGNF